MEVGGKGGYICRFGPIPKPDQTGMPERESEFQNGESRFGGDAQEELEKEDSIQSLWERSLDPPHRPTDLIESALFLPLDAVGLEHQGRKVRIVGQIFAFDPKTGYLLLTAPNTPNETRKRLRGSQQSQEGRRAVVVVDLKVPLLGISPSVKDLSDGAEDFWKLDLSTRTSSKGVGEREKAPKALGSEFESKRDRIARLQAAKEEAARERERSAVAGGAGRVGKVGHSGPTVPRPMLSLGRGEWVTVVGWLEAGDKEVFRRIRVPKSYRSPLRLTLEAIHVRSSRPPPPDVIYRGQLPT